MTVIPDLPETLREVLAELESLPDQQQDMFMSLIREIKAALPQVDEYL